MGIHICWDEFSRNILLKISQILLISRRTFSNVRYEENIFLQKLQAYQTIVNLIL